MKLFICLVLVGLSTAAPQSGNVRRQAGSPPRSSDEPLRILRFDNVNNGDGSYSFGYETENGISVGEEGVVRASRGGEQVPITAVKGFFEYADPVGDKKRVDYTADEDGFVPRGAHLPTPPPIPEAIMRSLAILYSNAQQQKRQERSNQNRPRF